MKLLKYLFALVALTLLAACGGGGGNPGSPSGGGGGMTVKPTLVLQVFNSGNVAVSEVTSGGGSYVKAIFKDADGAPIAGRLVTFSVNSGLATLAKTTDLTNSVGEAQVDIFPTAGATGGAATLQASALNGTATITGSLDVAVAAAAVPVIVSPTIAVQIFNSANVPVSNVTFGGGNYVKATFTDATGGAIVNRLVTFSLSGATIATISPLTALTNSSGVAQVTIAPSSVSAVGAATLSVQATDAGASYTASADFAVTQAAVTLGPLTLGSTSLNPGGNTSVTISALSNSVAAAGVNVALMADCGTVNPVVTTDGSGVASATYSAIKADGSSCVGTVTLSASASGATGVQKATLTVAAPVANAINFVSATPAQIFIKGSGATEQSIVKFKVLDSVGVAMPNIPVVFSLTVNPGGVGVGASGAFGNVTVNSDSAGIASVSIFSGTIPGPIEVKAALVSAPSVFTTSKNLTVASGPPSQDFFSFGAETYNIEGWDINGTSTKLTVHIADRQGNPVPDGTVINFTAAGGQVATSCATARVNGIAQCTVAFISQNPKPANGRIAVLAYAEGLKQFTDVNGNNAYDAGVDILADLGDAYRDDNENGQYDVGEFVIPKGGTQVCSGSGDPSPSRANTCTGTSTLAATVRQQLVLMIPSSSAAFSVIFGAGMTNETFVTVRINSAAHPLLPMPAGTTVSADNLSSACAIGKISPPVVPNKMPSTPSTNLGTNHSIGLTGCGGTTIVIKATSPSGVVSSFAYVVPSIPVVVPPDATAPIFSSAPAVDMITTTSARLSAMINEAGYGYYVVQPTASAAPSLAVLLSTTPVPMIANTPVFVPLTSLTANTGYTVYMVAKDMAGNTQATVSSAAFTTLP